MDADKGTPDPTSIAIALFPTEAWHVLPSDILDRTFRDYDRMVKERDAGSEPYAYTPYEMRNILALTTLGYRKEAFDLHEFHDVILGNGPMPLEILEKVVDDYIATKLAFSPSL